MQKQDSAELSAAALNFYKKNSSKFLAVSFLVLLLSLFIAGYPVTDIYNKLFLPQPERVTELYFDNPTHLPVTVLPGKPVQFAFRAVNHESSATTYTYVVSLVVPGSPAHVVKTGNFTLTDGRSSYITVTFSIPTSGVRSLVTVQLSGRSETIHFWVNS